MTKKAWFITGSVLALSIVAFLVMHYLLGQPLKKSEIVTGGAGAAMIVMDVLLPLRKLKRSRDDEESDTTGAAQSGAADNIK